MTSVIWHPNKKDPCPLEENLNDQGDFHNDGSCTDSHTRQCKAFNSVKDAQQAKLDAYCKKFADCHLCPKVDNCPQSN